MWTVSLLKYINTLLKTGICWVLLNGVVIGNGPEILTGSWGCQKEKKNVAELAMGTLCTIQASSASESTQAELLGRHERNSCAERAVASFPSERPHLRTVKIGSKSTYHLITMVGFWHLQICSRATVWTVTELNSISELNKAFDLPELCMCIWKKNQTQICLGEGKGGGRRDKKRRRKEKGEEIKGKVRKKRRKRKRWRGWRG